MGTATGTIQFEIHGNLGGANCFGLAENITPPETSLGTEWMTISTPTSTASLTNMFVVIYFRKTDGGPDPFDAEIDMIYVAPTGSAGWQ
jgi:hypothetical protein